MRYRRTRIAGATYFLTFVTHARADVFAHDDAVVTWRRSVASVQRSRPFVVEAEVILPDHLHVLWSLPDGDADYATRVRLVKTAFTKALGNAGARSGGLSTSRASKGERNIWQRRYWEHVIRDEEDFAAHVDYIHINPVKHGLVARPSDWPHSTFAEWMTRGVYDAWWGSSEMPPIPDWAGHE